MTDHDSTTPEIPLTLSVDGSIGAVDFIRRLHRGGLQLRNADDGSFAVIVLADSEPPRDPFVNAPLTGPGSRLEAQLAEIRAAVPLSATRRQLFQASGICHAVGGMLDAADHVQLDETQLASALEAAGKLIDDAASALESAP